MIIVVATTAIVGLSRGIVIEAKICHSEAPSTRAASITSGEMPLRPAERMTVQKPVQIQTATAIRARLLPGALVSQAWGSPPTDVNTALTVPVCGTSGGR